jgi:hypothetical protein
MKQHRYVPLLLSFVLISATLQAQSKKDLTLSAGAGWIKTPDYYKGKTGANYIFDFEYGLTSKSILWYGFSTGNQRYFDTLHNSAGGGYVYGDGTNANVSYYNFSLGYKYRFINRKQFSAAAGAGFALSVVNDTRPFVTVNTVGPRSSANLDLVFPIRLEFDYQLVPQLKVGLYGGTFIQPDYPFMGNHAGVRIGYILH